MAPIADVEAAIEAYSPDTEPPDSAGIDDADRSVHLLCNAKEFAHEIATALAAALLLGLAAPAAAQPDAAPIIAAQKEAMAPLAMMDASSKA
jgi:hypothetical protein